jgi:hypothetical protein
MRVMRHAYVRRPRTEGARVMRIACSQQASCVSPVPSTRSLLAIAASVVCAVRQMPQLSCTRATFQRPVYPQPDAYAGRGGANVDHVLHVAITRELRIAMAIGRPTGATRHTNDT